MISIYQLINWSIDQFDDQNLSMYNGSMWHLSVDNLISSTILELQKAFW